MTLIALGDTHGRTNWKRIVAQNDFDIIVFIGDYFDTHESVSPEDQLSNFNEIVAFKEANLDRVVLLMGNHDYHYLRSAEETYSGFQDEYALVIEELLHKALDAELLQMCYAHDSFLFSHAGVTKTWLKSVGYTDDEPLEIFINKLFAQRPEAFRFTAGRTQSPYGDDVTQPPIWVRPRSLMQDGVQGYVQVVGHTPQDELLLDSPFIFIDTLGRSGQFLAIVDGQMETRD